MSRYTARVTAGSRPWWSGWLQPGAWGGPPWVVGGAPAGVGGRAALVADVGGALGPAPPGGGIRRDGPPAAGAPSLHPPAPPRDRTRDLRQSVKYAMIDKHYRLDTNE